MKTSKLALFFISLLASPHLISTSPTSIQLRANSLEFGVHPTTISAALSFPGPNKPPSRSSFSSSTKNGPSKPTDIPDSERKPEDAVAPTSISRITDPIITHAPTIQEPLTTFIQDDSDLQPSGSWPPGSNYTKITCRNFPTESVFKICNTKLLVFIFLLLYIIVLRTIMYLQELSAIQVLDLGERLARCRDSYDGWAWETRGSWKIKQQPDLPGIAMLGVNYGATNTGDADEEGAREDGGIKLHELDLDYRRRGVRKGNTTPEEEQRANAQMGLDGPIDERHGQSEELTKEELEERRIKMVRLAHERILNDTKSKRIVYGVGISFASLGVAFAILAALVAILCGQVWRVGRCPYPGIEL
ncbi:hypothetical protein H072_9751 [Dactylellina haptotyla CBS 200.50]|uniref:Uncharacterized protein n=1 Tax=Dactylellina haptotyla (strain CBS 200.50) TaxID=1284197 RepID=S8BN47_DACHA|nr:hypothetical protein H072_9751 [Dactylellina haptotyla CBS 200.50]